VFSTKEGREASRALAQFGSMGITLALGVALFAGLGWWLDQKLGTEPVALASLCLLGAVLSLVKVVRDVQRWSDETEPGAGPEQARRTAADDDPPANGS
jgi:F0F1-type ATP synthase assembly protein I